MYPDLNLDPACVDESDDDVQLPDADVGQQQVGVGGSAAAGTGPEMRPENIAHEREPEESHLE